MRIRPLPKTVFNDALYRDHVHNFYGGELHEVEENLWCEERISYLLAHVRSDFGQVFLCAEAGYRLAPANDVYLNDTRQIREFLGVGVLRKHPDTQASSFHKFDPERIAKSAKNNPGGYAIMSEVFPLGIGPQDPLAGVAKKDIPLPPLGSEARSAYDFDQVKYRALRSTLERVILETKERLENTWFLYQKKKVARKAALLLQQKTIRDIDHMHAIHEGEFASLVLQGEDLYTPLFAHLQHAYAEIEDVVNEMEEHIP